MFLHGCNFLSLVCFIVSTFIKQMTDLITIELLIAPIRILHVLDVTFCCFECKRSLGPNIRAFFAHLRIVHHAFSTSRFFQCAQVGCHRSFSIIRLFRRHLLDHLKEFTEEVVETPSVEPGDSSSDTVVDAVEHCDEDSDNIFEECDDIVDEECDGLEVENMKGRVALFLAKLRSNSSQTLSAVNYVVEHTSGLISDIVRSLQRQTVSFLKETGHVESPNGQKLLEHFASAAHPFQGFESEYKQMQYFTQFGCFVKPEEVPFPCFSYTQERCIDRDCKTSGSPRHILSCSFKAYAETGFRKSRNNGENN